MDQANSPAAGQLVGGNAVRVIPLLQSLSRVEELTSALAMRLDPITNHVPEPADKGPNAPTITGRLNSVGDVLQYLLDHIEL